ncbi:MAG: hypothetical protein M3220_13355 [Chloroflexota bacterium]|nr:hypothetical protein [Chloroflexota bacterium]
MSIEQRLAAVVLVVAIIGSFAIAFGITALTGGDEYGGDTDGSVVLQVQQTATATSTARVLTSTATRSATPSVTRTSAIAEMDELEMDELETDVIEDDTIRTSPTVTIEPESTQEDEAVELASPEPSPTPRSSATATRIPPTSTPTVAAPTAAPRIAASPTSPPPTIPPSSTPPPPPPTTTPIILPTATPVIIVPSATPTEIPPPPVAYSAPTLLAPADGAGVSVPVSLSWAWNGTLQENEYFDVRVWHEGAPQQGITWTKASQFTLSSPDFQGDYLWSVAVIRGEGGALQEVLSPAASPRRIRITSGGTAPTPEPTEPPIIVEPPTSTPAPEPEPPTPTRPVPEPSPTR